MSKRVHICRQCRSKLVWRCAFRVKRSFIRSYLRTLAGDLRERGLIFEKTRQQSRDWTIRQG